MYNGEKLPGWIALIVISLFGFFFSIYAIFSLNKMEALSTANALIFIALALFSVFLCVVGAVNTYRIISSIQRIKKYRKELEIVAVKKEKLDFFKKCTDNGIYEITDENKTDFMIVAKNSGIDDYNMALDYFNFGLEQSKAKKLALEAEEISKETQMVEQYYKQALEISSVIGKQKYLNALEQSLTDYKLVSETFELAYSVGRSNVSALLNDKGADPYIVGGMAAGIGGTAAGVAAFADTQKKNQERQERNKQSASLITKQTNQIYVDKRKNDRKIANIENIKNNIANVLVDDSMSAEKFNTIDFTVDNYCCLRSGNLSIHISAMPKNASVMLLNKAAVLDGSFKVIVCCDGVPIGETIAYVGLSDNLDSNNIGYGSEESHNIVAFCKPYSEKQFAADENYTFEFEDIHTWAIQKW